jgi:hypothetical protein
MRRIICWTVVLGLLLAAGPIVGCGGGGGALPPVVPFIVLTNFQAADVVVGQDTFATNAAGDGPNRMSYPGGPSTEGSLFVGEYANCRVLGFNTIPTTNGASADIVLGQPDFTTTTPGTSATKCAGVWGVHVAAGKLFVPDYANHRVLIWNTVPTASNTPADVVVGQTDMSGGNWDTARNRFAGPIACAVVGTRLFVADQANHRIMVWNTIPTADGADADYVLGQGNFTAGMPATGNDRLNQPTGLWTDGARLVVADQVNNRVLIWNTIPTVTQQPADVVVGQPNFTTNVNAAGPQGMYNPTAVTSNGTQLIVADTDNHRVLVFDTFPTANHAAADRVLGQSDFNHNAANDDDQDGSADGTCSARTMFKPTGVHLVGGNRLIVTDGTNNRLLVFQGM